MMIEHYKSDFSYFIADGKEECHILAKLKIIP